MASPTPVVRGLRGRCPNCGRARILRGFWEIKDRCPSCHYGYVREDGYWVGAMTVLMAMIIVGFFATLVIGLLLTWPDPAWTGITVATVITNGAIALLGYSRAKTIWVGLDLAFTPPSVVEEAEMAASRAAEELGADEAAGDDGDARD